MELVGSLHVWVSFSHSIYPTIKIIQVRWVQNNGRSSRVTLHISLYNLHMTIKAS